LFDVCLVGTGGGGDMVLLVSSLSLDEDLALEGLDKGLAAKVLSMELDLLCLANFNMIDQFKP